MAITTLGNFVSVGGTFKSAGDLDVHAGGNVILLAQQTGTSVDETSHHVRSQGQTVTVVPTTAVAGGKLTFSSGGNIALQASTLSGQTDDLDAKGGVEFLAGHDVASSQVSGTQIGLFTQRILDHGRSDESLVYPSITGQLTIHAGGIGVEYEAGQDVRTGTGKKTRFDHLVNAVDGDATPRAMASAICGGTGLRRRSAHGSEGCPLDGIFTGGRGGCHRLSPLYASAVGRLHLRAPDDNLADSVSA